jgi:hypothetical protein
MVKYNLIMVFGKDKESNDQILLVKKNKGPKKDLWNGLGGRGEEGYKDFYNQLAQLKIEKGLVTSRWYGVIKQEDGDILIFSVHINQNLNELNFTNTNPAYKFWIRDPFKTIKAALSGKGVSQDLAYIIPMAMDLKSDYTINRL